jgi:hypothetical protein
MSTTDTTLLLSLFPTETLSLIAGENGKPTHSTLTILQAEVNGNAMSVSSREGGQFGHAVLTYTAVAYAELTGNIPFEVPENPPVHPEMPDAGATQYVILAAGRAHAAAILVYERFYGLDKILRGQIIKACPAQCIRKLKHSQHGFSQVTTLQMLTHLWSTYGQITENDMLNNQARMAKDWHPPTDIEALFTQLEEGAAFAEAGGATISEAGIILIGYQIILKTGLFEVACREWRKTVVGDRTMNSFQSHFQAADTDRTGTLGMAGYHSTNLATNHSANLATTQPLTTAQQDIKDLQASFTALALAFATKEDAGPPIGQKSYCWTHGFSNNLKHSSSTCEHKKPGHQDHATATNKLGGSKITWKPRDNRNAQA